MLTETIVAIMVAIIGYVIGIIKDRQTNLNFEDKYVKYTEMEEAIAKIKEAYESPTFTTQAFNSIIKECKDVFDRAQELLKKRA